MELVKSNQQRVQIAKAEVEAECNKSVSTPVFVVFKKLGGKHKRIRKRCKSKPYPELYSAKVKC